MSNDLSSAAQVVSDTLVRHDRELKEHKKAIDETVLDLMRSDHATFRRVETFETLSMQRFDTCIRKLDAQAEELQVIKELLLKLVKQGSNGHG